MLRYRKIFLITFIWIPFLVFCEREKAEAFIFFDLPLPFNESANIVVTDNMKLFSERQFVTLVKKGFPKNKDDKEQYLFIKSLYLMEDWIHVIYYGKLYDKKSFLYPYIAFYTFRAYMKRKLYSDGFQFYQKEKTALSKMPFPDEISEVYEETIANLNLPGYSKDLGLYYFKRYQADPKNKKDLLKSILLGEKDAVRILDLKNYKRLIPKNQLEKTARICEKFNTSVAISIYKDLRNWKQTGFLYFKEKDYKNALKYLPKDSFEASCSRLAIRKHSQKDLILLGKNLEESYPLLANYLIEKEDFEKLYLLLLKKYRPGYLRDLVFGLMRDKKYYKILQYLQELEKASLSLEERLLLNYWLGYLLILDGKNEKGTLLLKHNAVYYPYYFYGWQAYNILQNKEEIQNEWKKEFSQNLEKMSPYIEKMDKIHFDMEDEYSLFFVVIGEINKGFQLLKNKYSTLNQFYFFFIRLFRDMGRTDLAAYYSDLFYTMIQKQCDNALFYKNLFHELFPLKYSESLKTAQKEMGIESFTLASVIRQESVFYPTAVSWVGARGLMQLMPKTAAPILKALTKRNLIKNTNLFEPHTNILSGAYHLKWLYQSLYKDIAFPYQDILALASYNGGHVRIQKHYQSFPENPDIVFLIETIPMAETREYVKKVLFYKEIYTALYQ
ncbi:MAG TPA: hypothetical protein DHW82_02110 [Spirochaetia bacterium]|nr:MAG: hypothetical protein A2Y41_10655 [Spirochaetes bacterium GWB1_36_13]HCL55791.1 hypothetical protein [Spirochaetia bacterium]